LFLSPWLPHPEIRHAGGQHFYHTIRSLSERGHRVHVLCYGRHEPEAQVAASRAVCDSLQVVTPAYSWRAKAERFWDGGWRRPWEIGRRTHIQMRTLIQAIGRERGVDVVHLAWTEMGRYLDAIPAGAGTILGTQDAQYLVRPREAQLHPTAWARWRAGRIARHLIRAERRYARRADVVLASSNADRNHLACLGEANRIQVVRPWIDADAMRAVDQENIVPGRLTFMGAMDRMANVAAAGFLIEKVWPLISGAQANTTLAIVGANPPARLRHLAKRETRVIVTGEVPDLAAEWAATDVAVSPSLIGGGLLIKVAQPMAAGRPVVTTTLGNEGVAAPVGSAVKVADDARGFAAAVLRLLKERDEWARVAAAGRRHVLEQMDWQDGLDSLEAAYAAAVAGEKTR